MILETIIVGALSVNCFIVGCDVTKLAAVIDPGDNAAKILQVLDERGLKLKYIILTHSHFDHTGAAKELQEKTGAEVLVHKSDEVLLRNVEAQATLFGMTVPPAPSVDGYMKEGDTIEVGEIHMKVIETPGHTQGGVSLYVEDEKVVFTGDTLFWGSIGRTDLPGGDYATIMHSLKVKLGSLPDDTKVYCGHGDDTEIGFEKRENPFFD
jgi:glyoxylase-like metal-dependent hydrolase (beta-lactamase superfamily II)